MKNYRFDIDEWLPRLPLEERYGHYSAEIVTGPCDICQNEHLRSALFDKFDWGQAVPADVFIMAKGEAPDRHVTKIGGLPYLPSGQPWPTDKKRNPLLFVGQVNFADSLDITGPLPGDVLLVFCEWEDRCFDGFQFIWQSVADVELTAADQLPTQPTELAPCHGHIFRTVNFPDAKEILPSESEEYVLLEGREVRESYLIREYQATQISRAPYYIQGVPDNFPGQPLFTISSVDPSRLRPWPWINDAEVIPLKYSRNRGPDYLMMDDVGCLYVNIDESRKLHWTLDSY